MTCGEMMTPDPVCCVPSDNVVTAALLMKSHDVGSIPVVDDRIDRRLVGVLTDRDISVRVVAEQRDYYSTHTGEIMSRELVTCRAGDDQEEAVREMARHQVRRIPVVDDAGRLLGIIAQADVARQAAKRDEVGALVEEISQPEGEHDNGGRSIAKTSLLFAGGLGLGMGLLYLMNPAWARRAAGKMQ